MKTLTAKRSWKITDHVAAPGPLYWNFRCLRCDNNVSDHAPFFIAIFLSRFSKK